MSCTPKNMLSSAINNLRRLHDSAIKLSGKYRGYNNITLYRYSVSETDYKDETKTLLETVTGLSIYIDYPGDISNLSSNTPYVEDVLPITALFPWEYNKCNNGSRILKVDIKDEFEIILTDEFGNSRTHRFEIVDRQSSFEEQHVYREFIVAPKRYSDQDLTDVEDNETGGETPDGITDDENVDKVKDDTFDVYSLYD